MIMKQEDIYDGSVTSAIHNGTMTATRAQDLYINKSKVITDHNHVMG
jgi:hypothetical protein